MITNGVASEFEIPKKINSPLIDAYKIGMIVENKEIGIRFEVDSQQDFDKWYTRRKEQIRADAIDEFANKLIDELHYNVSAKPVTINTPYATPIMIYGEIQKIAEQLKEHK